MSHSTGTDKSAILTCRRLVVVEVAGFRVVVQADLPIVREAVPYVTPALRRLTLGRGALRCLLSAASGRCRCTLLGRRGLRSRRLGADPRIMLREREPHGAACFAEHTPDALVRLLKDWLTLDVGEVQPRPEDLHLGCGTYQPAVPDTLQTVHTASGGSGGSG